MVDVVFPIGLCGSTISNYILIDKLGEGSFGEVYLGQHNQTCELRALKIINLKKIMKERNQILRNLRLRLLKDEGTIMKNCNSPYVIKCFDVITTSESEIMVLEYCKDGDLHRHIKKKKRLTEEEALNILKQIVKGFAELHKIQVIHRDLKSENIFINDGVFKIGDLGLAKVMPNILQTYRATKLGTLTTMAPQVLTKQGYGIKADMWSLGVIFFEMLHGYTPFQSRNPIVIEQNIKDAKYQVNEQIVSKRAKELIDRMLVVNQNKRLSWTQLYDHPLINNQDLKESEVDVWICPDFYCQIQAQQQTQKRQIETQITVAELEIEEQLKIPMQINKSLDKNYTHINDEAKVKQLAEILQFELHRNQIVWSKIISPVMQSFIQITFKDYSWYILLVVNRSLLLLNFLKSSHSVEISKYCSSKQIQEKLNPLRKLQKQLENVRVKLLIDMQKESSSFGSTLKNKISQSRRKEECCKTIFKDYKSPEYSMGEQMTYTTIFGRKLIEKLRDDEDSNKCENFIQMIMQYESLAVAQPQFDQVYMLTAIKKYL